MKKKLTVSEQKAQYFKTLRALALTAFVCTVLLSIVIIIEGALPGKASSAQSNFVSDTLQSFGKEDADQNANLTTSRILVLPESRFAGEKAPLTVRFYPADTADTELIYSSSDESVATVDENGTVSYHKYGNTKLKATLKSNPKISSSATVSCYGTKPEDITDLRAENSALEEGTASIIKLFDQNGNRVSSVIFKVKSSDESIIKVFDDKIAGIREGSATLTFHRTGADFKKSVEFSVLANPNYIRPQSFVLTTDTVEVTAGESIDIDRILENALPAGASTDFDLSFKSEDGLKILTRREPHLFTANRFGKAQITITSYYNPDCKAKININVIEPVPSQLRIVGKKRAVVDTSLTLRAFGDGEYVYNVNWQVIRGSAKISENGVLSANRLGSVTVRATSVLDPTVYADIEIQVSLFRTFKSFVRKFIGHFMMFAVLGMGLTACSFLLIKPRGLYPVISAVIGFLLALLSELLQLPVFTTGRSASWTDVMLDTFGTVCGVALASVILSIYILIKKRADKDGYRLLKEVFRNTHAKTVFSKHGLLTATSDSEYEIHDIENE